ncbi:MAG: UvrD-helicase domain-containing protein [Chloroflexales bacterium]
MDDDPSSAQRSIIDYPSGTRHMLILAGPGSGKTRVIAQRVGHLLDQQRAEPEQLVVMTFTEKAASELVARLEDRLGSVVQGVQIGTIHNICNRLLVQHGSEIGLKPNFKIYDAPRQDEALRSAAARIGQPIEDRRARTQMSGAMHAYRTSAALALSRHTGAPEPDNPQVPELARAYRDYLHEHNALDFDDLILYGLRLFDTRLNPELAGKIHARIRYLFIDEFHDLSPEQFRLLELLVPPLQIHRQVCVVADHNQAIYGWRNADAAITIDTYRRRYRPEVFHLNENYRSAGNLVRAAHHLITSGGAQANAVPVRPDDYPIDLVACADARAEAEWLATQIKRACQGGTYHYDDIALLYRNNKRADLLEAILLREGIPLTRDQEGRFFDDPDVQATIRYLSLIQALRDEQFEPSLYWPRVLVDELTMAQIQTLAAAEQVPLIDIARRIDDYRDQVSPLTRTVIKDFLHMFEVELAEVADRPIGAIIQRLLAVLKQRRSPFPRAVRENVRGILESMALPLKSHATAIASAIKAGRRIVLTHDGAIDAAAGALILAHILEHYFQHPAVIQRRSDPPLPGAFVIALGDAREPSRDGTGIGVYTTPRGTLAYSVSVQAWRLGQMLLMQRETQRAGRFMLFDLETTGTHIRTTEILELAALEVEAEQITGRTFEALARPAGRIAPAASQVHGITEDQVKDKPTIAGVLPAYLDVLRGVTLVGHNVEAFDYPVIRRIANELGLEPPTGPIIDTCKLARRLLPDNSHRLGALADLFGYKEPQTHRALDDVRMNAEVFFRLLDLLDDERALDIASEVLPLVAIGLHASGLPLDDYHGWLFQAGARARDVGLGAALCRRLDELVTDEWDLGEHTDWLTRREHADPEEDRRWVELAQRWHDALRLYRQAFDDPSLTAFLRYVGLASTIDHRPGDEERITLMTIHSAKGKEWPLVFIIGAEEGTLPAFQCKTAAEFEEERRVLYVAMTRAKRRLCISHVAEWKGHHKAPSHLLNGIPEELIQRRTVCRRSS